MQASGLMSHQKSLIVSNCLKTVRIDDQSQILSCQFQNAFSLYVFLNDFDMELGGHTDHRHT